MIWQSLRGPTFVRNLGLWGLLLSATLIVSCSTSTVDLTDQLSSQPAPGIIFTSDRTENWDIFLIQADGSGLTQLTDFEGVDADPAWSPDGSQIAFRSRRHGSSDIFIMNPDGSNPINLINDPQASLDDEFAPQWHPDGETFSLYTDRYSPRGSCLAGFHQIALLLQEAGEYRVDLFDTIPGEQYASSWSPDGRYLVFNSACSQGEFQLFLYDMQSGETTGLTSESASHSHPAWSNDGHFLAFTKHVNGNNDIFLLDLNTNQQVQLTDHPSNDTMPTWSPDGTQIAFVSNRDGNKDIYIMDVAGGELVNLTNHPADDWYPSWSPVPDSP